MELGRFGGGTAVPPFFRQAFEILSKNRIFVVRFVMGESATYDDKKALAFTFVSQNRQILEASRSKVSAHVSIRGLYLFGCKVFGDTGETDSV